MLRPYLDRPARERLKALRDAYVRDQIRLAGGMNATRDWREWECPRCGAGAAHYTPGCKNCNNRHWDQKKQQRRREQELAA